MACCWWYLSWKVGTNALYRQLDLAVACTWAALQKQSILASVTVQKLLTCPSHPAMLDKMLSRVIALVFYLWVLNYCSPCTKTFFTVWYANKEEDFQSTLSLVLTVTYFKNKGPSIFYRLCGDGEEEGLDINEFRLTRLNILLYLTSTCLIFSPLYNTYALTNSFSKTCAICTCTKQFCSFLRVVTLHFRT